MPSHTEATIQASLQTPKKLESPFIRTCLQKGVALITGGGSGIGFEISKQLGLHGARVVIMGRTKETLENACNKMREEGITCAYVQGDVRSNEDAKRAVETTVKQFGGLDILINDAAGNFLALAEDTTPEGYDAIMKIDFIGTVRMCKAALVELQKSRNLSHPSIINISAVLQSAPVGLGAAAAAKAAVESITRTHAKEWGRYGIRCNSVAPGIIADTPGFEILGGNLDTEILNKITNATPLQTLPTPTDIAFSCIFLCSTAGYTIHGRNLVNDGGGHLVSSFEIDRDTVKLFSNTLRKQQKTKEQRDEKQSLLISKL